jgi:hypothetical protein
MSEEKKVVVETEFRKIMNGKVVVSGWRAIPKVQMIHIYTQRTSLEGFAWHASFKACLF